MTRTPSQYDVAVIGGGIVGLATARRLCDMAEGSMLVLEAEDRLATHQTGRNSGVIHSGLYYPPGSAKARLCTEGRDLLYAFCQEYGIRHERCGKLVVAVDETELDRLAELERRGRANGLQGLQTLNRDQIRRHEPHVAGVAGLLVPETGIVSFREVAEKLADLVRQKGHTIRTGAAVRRIKDNARNYDLETAEETFACRSLINCGGLQADRVARMAGVAPDVRIVPFRGEYYELIPQRSDLVRGLIYPVPDPNLPFLGVHFTRMIDGRVTIGPNAVLAFKLEGYTRSSFSVRDVLDFAAYPGFWRMAHKNWRTAIPEWRRSLSRRAFVQDARRLVPQLDVTDVRPAEAGVRAQAVARDGTLVNDFRVVETDRAIHVLNAPSPAATASLAIGRHLAELACNNFKLQSRK